MLAAQIVDIAQHAGSAGFDPAMIAVDRFGPAVGWCLRVIEQQPHVCQQRRLVLLERQNIVGPSLQQGRSDPTLALHGVRRDDLAFEVEHGHEVEQRVDLIAALA